MERGPGRSFAGLLTPNQRERKVRERIVVFDEYGPVRMIGSARWKYVHRHPAGPHELYELIADPGETVNLVLMPEHHEVVSGLRGELEDWFREHADPGREGATLPVIGTG